MGVVPMGRGLSLLAILLSSQAIEKVNAKAANGFLKFYNMRIDATKKAAGFAPGGRSFNKIKLEAYANADDGLMTVDVGFKIEIILANVEIAIVRIAILSLDEARWAEQVEFLLDTCAQSVKGKVIRRITGPYGRQFRARQRSMLRHRRCARPDKHHNR